MQVKIEKIVPEGKSLAHLEDGKVVFIWGGLPDEIVEINITKNKKNFAEAEIVEIVKESSKRIKPTEDHYIICSPWQVLTYEEQIKLKKQLLMEAFSDIAEEKVVIDEFYESDEKFGYRTKMEYSFTNDQNDKIVLAFHKRGTNNIYETIEGCKLASDKMNLAANKITDILNTLPNIEAKGLKSLTLRESKTNGQIIAVLLHKFREYDIKISLKDLDGLVDGIIIGYSTIKSPMSVITETRYEEGTKYLEEKIVGLTIRYPYDGFFQNNLPMFEQALNIMSEGARKVNKLVELYSGTGSIGLFLSKFAKEVSGVEIVESATHYAEINKKINNINNYQSITLADHKISADILKGTNTLVLDPPRAGLHPKTIKLILETLPDCIIYLSCNPVTQARDYALLKDNYKMMKLVGFDFYPNTLHMESLIILERN